MGVFGAIATWLAGCVSPSWTTVAQLPAELVPARVLPGDAILVFGFAGKDGQATSVRERRAEVWRVVGDGVERVLEAPGWFVDADARGERVWALRATPTEVSGVSRYLLHVSTDHGQSWTAGTEVPAIGLTHVRIAEGDAGWIHGVGVLKLTRDGGVSWTAASPPGTMTGLAEPLVVDGGTVVLGGATLRRSSDWGATWSQSGPRVDGTDGVWVVGGLQVGKLGADGVQWTGELPERLQVEDVASEGEIVRVSGFPLDAPGSVVRVAESRDGGVTFTTVSAKGDGQVGRVGVAEDGAVHVDLSGRVRVHE